MNAVESASVAAGPASGRKSASNLESVLAAGHFAVTGELGPPQSADGDVIRKKVEIFRGRVDAVNITDCQTAIVRLSSIASGAILVQAGLDPIVQMTCRDRNRIAIQSDLLGAAALRISNVLCLTGDHQTFGNHPQARNVFDIDSIQLIAAVRRMRDEARFMSGDQMKVPPRFFIGAVANPFADPFEFRVTRLAKKVAAGVDFIQTQGVYDVPRFERWMRLVRDHGLHQRVKILAGIIPTKSVAALKYMKESVSGMSVPDEYLERLARSSNPAEEGVAVAAEIIGMVRGIEGVAGVHIMPVMWESALPAILERANLLPRP